MLVVALELFVAFVVLIRYANLDCSVVVGNCAIV